MNGPDIMLELIKHQEPTDQDFVMINKWIEDHMWNTIDGAAIVLRMNMANTNESMVMNTRGNIMNIKEELVTIEIVIIYDQIRGDKFI